MEPTPRAFCAGSRKRLSSHSCFRFRASGFHRRGRRVRGELLFLGSYAGTLGGGEAALRQTSFGVLLLFFSACSAFAAAGKIWRTITKDNDAMANSSNLRVAVIGGGPGGYAAAFLAADLGMKVTLIDPEV